MQLTTRHKLLILWLLLTALAAVIASLLWPAAHLGGEVLPIGNDSFYHARRILDTVAGSFYEFDPKIHAPEGSLLVWPWGYDFAMAQIVRVGLWLGLSSNPMAILVWIPVAALLITIGLAIVLARRLSLSIGMTTLAGLCVALSPLTQVLHGVGIIDHHYAEYIFVLATLVAGMGWFENPASPRAAIILGVTLGLAPAIHNALFVVQIPIVITVLVRWLQGFRAPRDGVTYFCAALLVTTVAILLPSAPFRAWHFEFYTLSWFHLYIATGTAIVTFLTAKLTPTRRGFAVFGAAAVALLLPMAREIVLAGSFLTGDISRLDRIQEMVSLPRLLFFPGGWLTVLQFYSLFIVLLPVTAGYCALRLWRERREPRIFFWIAALCGLALLTMQFRLHYFGSFALFLPWLMVAQRVMDSRPQQRKLVMLASAMACLLLYSVPLRYRLVAPMPVANDEAFRPLHPTLLALRDACAREPGIVLTDNDAGHYVRYYTQCSVIANNFLLTSQHEDKIREIDRLLDLHAPELLSAQPKITYVLLRPVNVVRTSDEELRYTGFGDTSGQLLLDLLMSPRDALPAHYELLFEVTMKDDENIPWARLLRIRRDSPQS